MLFYIFLKYEKGVYSDKYINVYIYIHIIHNILKEKYSQNEQSHEHNILDESNETDHVTKT